MESDRHLGTSALPRSKSLAKTLSALWEKGGCLQGRKPCLQGSPPSAFSRTALGAVQARLPAQAAAPCSGPGNFLVLEARLPRGGCSSLTGFTGPRDGLGRALLAQLAALSARACARARAASASCSSSSRNRSCDTE